MDKHIRQTCLNRRMQVDLGLLEDQRGTLRRVVAKSENWKDLGNAESNICDENGSGMLRPSDYDFIELTVSGDWSNLEAVYEPELFQPAPNLLLDGQTD